MKISIVCVCAKCKANEVDEFGSDSQQSSDTAIGLPKNMALYIIHEVHMRI